VVDQAAVADVLQEVVKVFFVAGKLVECRPDFGGVGGPPMGPEHEEDHGDDRKPEHAVILA
jgi:hypothetical protein